MLLWYSQEARAYALLRPALRRLAALLRARAASAAAAATSSLWGIASALALATHYFAVFPIAAEALWLLRRRGRASAAGPRDRRPRRPARWRRWRSTRCRSATPSGSATSASATGSGRPAATFVTGETGDIIARPERPALALVPLAARRSPRWRCSLVRGERERAPRRGAAAGRRRRRGRRSRSLLALVSPGKDYVLARNLMPALVPLLVAVAIARHAAGGPPPRRRRSAPRCSPTRSASASGPASRRTCSAPTGTRSPRELGEPQAPRAIVTWTLGEASLRYYLSTGAFQVVPAERLRLARPRNRLRLRRRGAAAARRGCSAPASAKSATKTPAGSTSGATRCPARAWRRCGCARCATPSSTSATTASCSTASGPAELPRLGVLPGAILHHWRPADPARRRYEPRRRRRPRPPTAPPTSTRPRARTPTCSD